MACERDPERELQSPGPKNLKSPRYLTITDAALASGRSPRTIQRWITAGIVPSRLDSTGKRRILLTDVMKAERSQRQRTTARQRVRARMWETLHDLTPMS